jgi:hypothetical protein
MTITTQTIELQFWRLHRHDQLGDLRVAVERDDEGGMVQLLIWGVRWTWLADAAQASVAC